MKVLVAARVREVIVGTGSGSPAQIRVYLDVDACEDNDYAHRLYHLNCDVDPTIGCTTRQFNDAIVSGVITAVQSSTPGVANSWVVDRNDVLVSGLFQRA
jgi:hypothetical protein